MKFFRIWLSLIPFFFPLYIWRFEVGGVPTTFIELLVGVTLLWAGGLLVQCHESVVLWLEKQKTWKSPLWPVLLFGVAATISLLIVPGETISVDGSVVESSRVAQGIWKGWIVMPILYFLMVWITPKDKGFWARSGGALIGSGAFVAIPAVLQMISGEFVTWDGRASGFFESANYLSLYLGPVLFLTFVQILNLAKHRNPASFTFFPFLFLMVMAFWGTKSYAAFIGLAAGLAGYFLFHQHTRKKVKFKAAALGAVLAILLVMTQWQTPKFQQFVDFEGRSSSSVRIEVYEVALELIKERPLTGWGLGQFEVQYALHAPDVLGHAPMEWVMLHPHNFLLSLWVNTGLMGVVAMIWLVLLVLFKRPKSERRYMGLMMLLIILTHGFFDTPFFKNDLAYLWWVVVAMGL